METALASAPAARAEAQCPNTDPERRPQLWLCANLCADSAKPSSSQAVSPKLDQLASDYSTIRSTTEAVRAEDPGCDFLIPRSWVRVPPPSLDAAVVVIGLVVGGDTGTAIVIGGTGLGLFGRVESDSAGWCGFCLGFRVIRC